MSDSLADVCSRCGAGVQLDSRLQIYRHTISFYDERNHFVPVERLLCSTCKEVFLSDVSRDAFLERDFLEELRRGLRPLDLEGIPRGGREGLRLRDQDATRQPSFDVPIVSPGPAPTARSGSAT